MDWLLGRYRRRAATADHTPEPWQEPAQGQGVQVEPDEAYLLGASDAEISRLDFQQYMFRLAFNGDYSVPLQAPQDILDVACGTGRWAREMAQRFATANVIGFDINPSLTDVSLAEGTDTVPDNFFFLMGDALQPFQFSDASFDFVVARVLGLHSGGAVAAGGRRDGSCHTAWWMGRVARLRTCAEQQCRTQRAHGEVC